MLIIVKNHCYEQLLHKTLIKQKKYITILII